MNTDARDGDARVGSRMPWGARPEGRGGGAMKQPSTARVDPFRLRQARTVGDFNDGDSQRATKDRPHPPLSGMAEVNGSTMTPTVA